ncbi:hypothetical protein ACFPIJ_51400 [Dactylosporangium cerinum]|uniref:Uncharacterized protein n=1 Tax=Dactylosporangium cerinum TaxID=1434730 RepID=A0ABV9WCX8_9ACTN
MVRTTPARPVDLAAAFPALREHTAVTTRLHPRPGAPTVIDSSVGGPLLWPADEPWPACTDTDHEVISLHRPDTVRQWRAFRAATAGLPYDPTGAERAGLPPWDFSEPPELARPPIPLVPVVQLYRREMPDLVGPADADLLQVLWCPHLHPDLEYCPRVELRWRRSAEVTAVLTDPPESAVLFENHLPTPCIVHPEQVTEYRDRQLLPADLQARIVAWQEQTGNSYQQLSAAKGWRVGGFVCWALSGLTRWRARRAVPR